MRIRSMEMRWAPTWFNWPEFTQVPFWMVEKDGSQTPVRPDGSQISPQPPASTVPYMLAIEDLPRGHVAVAQEEPLDDGDWIGLEWY